MLRTLVRLFGAAALILVSLGRSLAQHEAPPIDVVAVLAMARAAAESATDKDLRFRLHQRVVGFIRRTGQRAAFEAYVAEVTNAAARERDHKDQAFLKADKDRILKANLELEIEARRVFFAGNAEAARQLLRLCRPSPAGYSICVQRHLLFSHEVFVEALFLMWEIEAEDLAGALHRLKGAGWPAELWPVLLLEAGPYIAAGGPEMRAEIKRLVRLSGNEVASCIVDPPSFHDFRRKSQPLSEAATLRKLACEGRAHQALAMAHAIRDASQRTTALGIIAEGLAGVPGAPQEWLDIDPVMRQADRASTPSIIPTVVSMP